MATTKGLYSTEDMKKVFQHGVTRGILLTGMIYQGRMKNEDVAILDKYWPDFKEFIKKEINKD